MKCKNQKVIYADSKNPIVLDVHYDLSDIFDVGATMFTINGEYADSWEIGDGLTISGSQVLLSTEGKDIPLGKSIISVYYYYGRQDVDCVQVDFDVIVKQSSGGSGGMLLISNDDILNVIEGDDFDTLEIRPELFDKAVKAFKSGTTVMVEQGVGDIATPASLNPDDFTTYRLEQMYAFGHVSGQPDILHGTNLLLQASSES